LGKNDVNKHLTAQADKIKHKHTLSKLLLFMQRGPFYIALYTIKGVINTILIIWLYLKGKKHFSKHEPS
jgi:hypothetical protein